MMDSGAFQEIGRTALAFGSALGLAFFLTPLVRATAVRVGLVAKPVEDRWGRRVIARLGGVAMFLGFVAATLCWIPWTPPVRGLLVGALLVFSLGLLDDIRRMPPYTKLVGQLLIGCVVVLQGIRIELAPWPWVSIPLSILWFVLVMNAFNLLDNMDGLAAGVGAIAAGFCAVHAALAQEGTVMLLNAALCGACLGFLRYNFPPAKIYMGDAGSHFIGFSLAALSLAGTWRHSTQLLSVLAVPTLVLAVPIFDTCFVVIQRLSHRQHPFTGGKDHVSHRLAILGLSVQQTVVALYIISACLGLVSLMTAALKPPAALATWFAVATVLVLFGLYLARVNVYRLEEPSHRPGWTPGTGSAGPTTLIETMLLHKRRLVEILVDFTLICSCYVFAHLLRFEGQLSRDLQRLIVQSLPIILVSKLACFSGCGLYRGIWRYLGLSDLITMARAVTLGSLFSAVGLLYFWRFEYYSRAVFIIDWMLTLLAVGGSRVVERLLDEWIAGASPKAAAVVIIGAGDTGARVVRWLKYEDKKRRVIGFLDDDVSKQGDRILGSSVLGRRERLPELLDGSGICEVLVAISDPPGELLEYVRGCCESRGVAWRVVTAGVISHA